KSTFAAQSVERGKVRHKGSRGQHVVGVIGTISGLARGGAGHAEELAETARAVRETLTERPQSQGQPVLAEEEAVTILLGVGRGGDAGRIADQLASEVGTSGAGVDLEDGAPGFDALDLGLRCGGAGCGRGSGA